MNYNWHKAINYSNFPLWLRFTFRSLTGLMSLRYLPIAYKLCKIKYFSMPSTYHCKGHFHILETTFYCFFFSIRQQNTHFSQTPLVIEFYSLVLEKWRQIFKLWPQLFTLYFRACFGIYQVFNKLDIKGSQRCGLKFYAIRSVKSGSKKSRRWNSGKACRI